MESMPGNPNTQSLPTPEQQANEASVRYGTIALEGIKLWANTIRAELANSRIGRLDQKMGANPDDFREPTTPVLGRLQEKRAMNKFIKRSAAQTEKARIERIHGPKETLPGRNNREVKRDVRSVGRARRNGELSAFDAYIDSKNIKGSRLKLGELPHKQADKAIRKTERLDRLRTYRKDKATRTLSRAQLAAQQNREKIRQEVAKKRNASQS